MTIGIPEQTKNSFGITYLSKEESVGSHPESKYGKLSPKDQVAIHSTPTESRTPAFGIRSQPRSTSMNQHSDPLTGVKLGDKTPKAEATTSTRTQFTNPNFTTQRIKPLATGGTDPSIAPKARQQHLGGRTHLEHGKVEAKHGVSPAKKPNNTGQGAGGAHNVGKQPHKEIGDAPKGTKFQKEGATNTGSPQPKDPQKVGGKQVKVGVGSTAHRKFQSRDGVGEDNTPPKSEKDVADGKKDRKIRYARSEVGRLERKEMFDKLTGIKSKAQLIIIKAQLLKVTAERYVRPSMASAGKKPATKMPNAGGIQDKLDMMSADSKNSTPDANTETSVTGSDKKVSDRYS